MPSPAPLPATVLPLFSPEHMGPTVAIEATAQPVVVRAARPPRSRQMVLFGPRTSRRKAKPRTDAAKQKSREAKRRRLEAKRLRMEEKARKREEALQRAAERRAMKEERRKLDALRRIEDADERRAELHESLAKADGHAIVVIVVTPTRDDESGTVPNVPDCLGRVLFESTGYRDPRRIFANLDAWCAFLSGLGRKWRIE